MDIKSNFAEWDKLYIFYYVAKLKTLSRTATYLNISQPTLTKSIQLLEYRLKTTLFIRQPKGMVLTQAGEELFKIVDKFYSSLYNVKNSFHETEESLKGYLKVAATTGVVSLYLVPNLPIFLKKYPDLRVNIQANDNSPDFDLYEADIIVHPYISNRNDLIQEPLLKVHYKLYASPRYLEKYGIPQTPQDLDHHKLIGFGDHSHPYANINWHLMLGSLDGRPREPYVQINSAQARFHLADEGFGIMTAPQNHPGLKGRKLVEVLPHIPGPSLEMFCIYPKKLADSKRIKIFVDYLKSIIS